MKKFSFSGLIATVFFIFVCYWLYLVFNTTMIISADAIGFEDLGRLLQQKGLVGYLQSGPTREPLYPATISLSMGISSITGFAYLKIQTIFQVMIVFLSMWMIYMILRRIGVQQKVVFLCVFYFGLSPAIINSALSLYSEIITYPLMLGIIWVSLNIYEALENTRASLALQYSALLGLLLIAMTMVKGTFELVAPIYLLVFMVLSWRSLRNRAGVWKYSNIFIFGFIFLFWAGAVGEYKSLNQKYNGNFLITNRGPRHFYANMVMRTESLTQGRLKASLASIPGDGVCLSFATKADCAFWNFQQGDTYGAEALNKFTQGNSLETASKRLFAEGVKGIGRNPWQYSVLTGVEALKMFFWESTRVGFVTYPVWLAGIYENVLIKNGLRLLIALLTIGFFFWTSFLGNRRPLGVTLMFWLAGIFILIQALGSVLTRYAFPVTPLYVCLIAFGLDNIFFNQRQNLKK